LYSPGLDTFYIGSCINLCERIVEHNSNWYENSFTSKIADWSLYFSIDELDYKQARNIEAHIKRMKSKRYIENLKKHKEISEKLKIKYK
jgi:putative endonuclease